MLKSEKLYMAVLKEYYNAIDKKYRVILEYKEAERWQDYTIEVHALKSTSRQIGAVHISELAAEMEKAGNDKNIELINEKNGAMLEEYLKLKDILKPYFADISESGEQFAQFKEIMGMLDDLQAVLNKFDTLEVDAVIEKMSNNTYGGIDEVYFEQLKEAAESGDIDMCSKIVGEWSKAIACVYNKQWD